MRAWESLLLGLAVASALITLTEPTRESRIALVEAVVVADSRMAPEGQFPTPTLAAPLAPPDSRPQPVALPPVAASFTPAPPGERPFIPILMYHYVRYVDQGADPLGYGLSVTPDQLGAQLAWLKAAGYEAVRMDAVAACLRSEGPCPAHAVAITFDDGYLDAYTTALPILQQYGYPATFYIVSDFVGQPGYAGWEELRAMHRAGMELGAHSVSHPDLTTLGLEDLRDQVARSGARISEMIGAPVRSFCYPGGRFDPTVAAVVSETGFTSATTTMPDLPQNDPYTLPRLRIAGDTGLEGFQWMVQAYLP